MEYLACHAFCSGWTCDWVSLLVMFNHKLLCLNSISSSYWINLTSSILTTLSNFFPSDDLIELSLIYYYLFLLIIQTPMLFPSPPLGIWLKTLRTIFLVIWLVRPISHAKNMRTLYPYIPGGFNYSITFIVYILTKYCTRSGITLSASCVDLNKIFQWPHVHF